MRQYPTRLGLNYLDRGQFEQWREASTAAGLAGLEAELAAASRALQSATARLKDLRELDRRVFDREQHCPNGSARMECAVCLSERGDAEFCELVCRHAVCLRCTVQITDQRCPKCRHASRYYAFVEPDIWSPSPSPSPPLLSESAPLSPPPLSLSEESLQIFVALV